MKTCGASLTLLTTLLLGACGGQPPPAVSSTDESADGDRFGICRMLSASQVASVMPGSDEGMVASNGGSLIEGVDTYQCSYTAARDGDVDLLTVIVTVARDDERFAQIEPSGFAFDEEDKVDLGDGGWIKDEQADQFGIVARKGRSVLRMELMASGAQDRSATMIELARAVVDKL